MRSSKCVCSTATALHRVFVAPIEQSHLTRHGPQVLPSRVPAPKLFLSAQRRNFVVARPANTSPQKSRLPRDEEITSWSVSLVGEHGKLNDPRPTSDVLASFDRKTHSLVVVVPGEPGVPPICKLIDKKKEWAAAKAKKKQKQASAGAVPEKTMELNWAIEQGDLVHRLARIKEFLEKGHRVEIVLAPKRKGKQATPEEAEELVQKIKEVVTEAGAREMKPMDGTLLKIATIFTEGKVVKKP